MNNSIVSLLLIQIILIALNAVFASAELAVLSVNESKINRCLVYTSTAAEVLFLRHSTGVIQWQENLLPPVRHRSGQGRAGEG